MARCEFAVGRTVAGVGTHEPARQSLRRLASAGILAFVLLARRAAAKRCVRPTVSATRTASSSCRGRGKAAGEALVNRQRFGWAYRHQRSHCRRIPAVDGLDKDPITTIKTRDWVAESWTFWQMIAAGP